MKTDPCKSVFIYWRAIPAGCFRITLRDQEFFCGRSQNMDLKGILLPVTTPFTADGELALDALRSNLSRWNNTGVIGYVLLGSTGERVHLADREYLQVIETARSAVPDNRTFIVGAGQQSTLGTINEIKN